jgi:hypothetical protein
MRHKKQHNSTLTISADFLLFCRFIFWMIGNFVISIKYDGVHLTGTVYRAGEQQSNCAGCNRLTGNI